MQVAPWKAAKRALSAAFAANIAALILAIFSSTFMKKKAEQAEPEFKARVAELESISASLRRLSDYVSRQQESLRTTAETLERLRNEKNQMETALHIDRDQLRSLAAVLEHQSRINRWIDRAVGFFIGTLSSLFAALIWERFRKS